MISTHLQTRPAETADQEQIASLMFFEAHVHRHLDWRSPLDWLGSPHYWALEDDGRVTATLACPQDPAGIAWLRFFAHHSRLSGPEAWSPLWEAVRAEINQAGGALVAAIATKQWFRNLLQNSGFTCGQNLVLLEWTARLMEPVPPPRGVQLRPMRPDDLSAVAETDSAAFDPLWRNSIIMLQKAFAQSFSATVAEDDGRIVGYQISTGNTLGVHLARLGVRKEAQGRGIGAALASDVILRMSSNYVRRLTVNTQADNVASLSLYRKIGFVQTGEQYPVLIYQV